MENTNFNIISSKDFVKLSGDNNPIHIDSIQSRRLLYGKTVVHGVYTLLKALDLWIINKSKKVEITSLTVKFIKPVFQDDLLELNVKDLKGDLNISIYCKSVLLATIRGTYLTYIEETTVSSIPYNNNIPDLIETQELSFDEALGYKSNLKLHLDETLFNLLFPNLYAKSSLSLMSVVLASTRLVGVHCPGSNSLYSELSLTLTDKLFSDFNAMVSKTYKSLNLIKIDIQAAQYIGEIKAFFRKEPQVQSSYEEVLNKVKNDLFKNQKALVIGGSRGLGEVVSKILAAGGAEVTITYSKGEEEANKISHEINHRGGRSKTLCLDVTNQDNIQSLNINKYNNLYYFATPFIQTSPNNEFNSSVLKKFMEFYVERFFTVVDSLRSNGLVKVFYPSTIFIEELPDNLKEYVVSKSAGENLCRYLNKINGYPHIYFPRLPKMKTDQTAGLFNNNISSSLPILLKEMIKFNAL